jgi:hypothetical protein
MPATVPSRRSKSSQTVESSQSLLPKIKKGKWGGRFMKRLFRRGKSQKHPLTPTSESVEEESATRYVSMLKGGSIEELDHTTVNLSYSGGSNPYSTDESCEETRARRKLAPSSTGESINNRSSDISNNSDPTSTSFRGNFSRVENSIAQLDVSNMRKASMHGRGTPVGDLENTSITSDTGFDDAVPFVFHTRSSSRLLEETCPTGSSLLDHGLEVVLTDNDEYQELDYDVRGDDIFMSFKSPTDDEWRDPFKSHDVKAVFPNIVTTTSMGSPISNKEPLPQRKLSTDFPIHAMNDNIPVPPSPALSLRSETSVTWVSHDDDDGDVRPVKEIFFPISEIDTIVTNGLVNETFFDYDSVNEAAIESAMAETLTPQSDMAREAIFEEVDSTPMNDDSNTNCKGTTTNDTSFAAVTFPFFWSSPNATSVRSAFTPQSAPVLEQPQYRLSPRRVQSSTDPVHQLSTHAADHSFESNGTKEQVVQTVQNAPSSAFLKRKSAFTGEDLLSQEAESFAEFLEDGQSSPIDLEPYNSPAQTNPSTNTFKNGQLSVAERLLFAMTESVDGSEVDAAGNRDIAIDTIEDPETEPTTVNVTDIEVEPTKTLNDVIPLDGVENPIIQNINLSYTGNSNLQSLVPCRTGSTEVFSKSISDDDADDEGEELTNNASVSYASSCTSYAPSTLQGSFTGEIKRCRSRQSAGVSQLPYCGVFIQDDVDDDEDDDEDYEEDYSSLPSEDFSVHRRRNSATRNYISQSSRRSRHNNIDDETPLLDQVRNELLETVQDLAREGSSVVMNFFYVLDHNRRR